MTLIAWILNAIRNPGDLIAWGGYPAITTIIFLETGALVFFLPGDSLLIVAGMFAARGDMNILTLNGLLIPSAILGPMSSYWIGSRMGPRIFNKPKSRFFNPDHVRTAHEFYERHGGTAIILARFMPIVRTFVPVVAGVAQMHYGKYTLYNIIGALAWVLSMTLTGYFLGLQFPMLSQHIEKVIIVVVLLSLLPPVVSYLKERRRTGAAPAPGPAAD